MTLRAESELPTARLANKGASRAVDNPSAAWRYALWAVSYTPVGSAGSAAAHRPTAPHNRSMNDDVDDYRTLRDNQRHCRTPALVSQTLPDTHIRSFNE